MEFGLCIEMALMSLPFQDRFKAAADAGLKNVEMWFVRDGSFSGTPEQLAKLAADAGVKITNTVIGSPNGKVGGGLTDPANRAQWIERAKMTLEFTAAAGIGASIVCTGNTVAGHNDAQMRQSVLDGLKATVDLAEKAGVTLLLEPLNLGDHAGYWLSSSDRGAELCRALGCPRMKMVFDCYHMQITEGDLVRHIERNMDAIGHFHAAGVPGRHELFHGEINYRYVVQQIQAAGFAGVFALEYAPELPDAQSLRQTLAYLNAPTARVKPA